MMNDSEEVTNDNTVNDITEPLLQNGGVNEENSKSDSEEEDDVPSVSFFSLFRYASCKDKTLIFFSIVFALINGCMCPINTLLFSAYIQSMVDYGISVQEGKPKVDIFLEATKTFAIYNSAVASVLVVFSYLATVFINTAAYNQVYKIRQEYLKAALNQDFEHFDTRKAGDFATKMTDHVVKLEDGIGEKLEMFIFYQASFLSSIIMALVKGWKLALLCLISFPVTMVLFGIAGVIASKLSKKEAEAADRAGSVVEEVLSSIRTVYAFNGQKKEIHRYDKHLSEARSINIKKGFFEGISSGMIYLSIFSSYALSFWFGYKLMIDEPDNYNADTMIAVFLGVMMGSSNFGISSYLMEGFGVATGAAAHIFYLIDNVPKINPLRDSGIVPSSIMEGNIELNNVTFQYPSRPDVPILKGVNLNVNRGQSVALVGHSGCGKSTIIQLISRYYDVADGNVSIDGYDVRDLSVRWLRAQIGLVSQEPVLFNTTIRENIRFGHDEASNADIEEAARQANAHAFIKKLPLGYDTLVGEKGASLSGGQKQRIAIARALVRDPHILLLDEATSALDSTSEAKVQRALDRARQGRTTIVIAHRLSTIKNVDKIYVFKDGTVVESGNHENLMNVKGHYYDMVMLQSSPDLNESDDQISIFGSDPLRYNEEEDEHVEIDTQEDDEALEEFEAPFTRVVQLNAPEWKSITLASVCSLTTGFAMPLLGLILSEFLSVLSNPNTAEVWVEVRNYALIFVGIGLISGLANFIMTFFYTVAGEHLTARLRKLMFVKLLELDVGFFDHKNNSTGALCARLSGEAASVQAATGQRIGTVLQGVGTLLLAVAAGIYFEWRLGLVSLSFVPPMLTVIYIEGRMVSDESSGTAKAMESSSKIAVEAVANIRTVASLGRENLFVEEYARQLQPALYIAKKATHLRGLIFGLSRGLFNLAYSATLYYGGILMVYHNVDYGIVLKCSQTLLMGSSSAANAFAYAPDFQRGLNAAGRIMLLLNRQSRITDPGLPATENFRGNGEAHLRDVLFKYPTRRLTSVLKNFNLDIVRNKTIALVGESGCGKSTVIQLLERYYDPDEGVVAHNRIPLPMLRLGEVRQCIGFVQQEPVLFDRTIAENIAYGDNSRQPSMNEIIEVAKQANIHEFIISLPSGYDTNVGAKGTQLSGGQKQRVAIARALIRQPTLLLLDEATSALDTESEKVVQEALDAASAGRTCVVIAHRLSTVRDADIICVLNDGYIVECGAHDELMQLRGHYYNLNQKACA